MDKKLEVKYANHRLAQQILREGLAIQDRFSAQAVYGPTGRGSLQGTGVAEIAEAKRKARAGGERRR